MRTIKTHLLAIGVAVVASLTVGAAVPASSAAAPADEIDASTTTATMASHTVYPGTIGATFSTTAQAWRREVVFNAPPGTGPFTRFMQVYYATKVPVGTFWKADNAVGGLWLINARTGKAAASVHAPWAYDRLGSRLPVQLTLAGPDSDQFKLSLVLPATRDRFPVTVDPHYTWGWITGTVYFNREETEAFAISTEAVSILAEIAPPPWGTVLSIYATVLNIVAQIAIADAECVALKSNGVVFAYSGSEGDGYCR